MKKQPKSALILGVINVLLPVAVVLSRNGIFGDVTNPWQFFWFAIGLALLPIVSSAIGILVASIQLRKTPARTVKAGLALSIAGLLMHLVFRFFMKL